MMTPTHYSGKIDGCLAAIEDLEPIKEVPLREQ